MDCKPPVAVTPRSEGDAPAALSQAKSLDALRADAARMLARIADESGADSRLHRLCTDTWRQREEDARVSVSHGDVRNALAILERALYALTVGRNILARSELALDDLEVLLRAA